MMARAGASKTMTQQEAGRLLSKKVKKHFDEFDREHRRKVAKQLRKIGIKEKANMKDRIIRNNGRIKGKKLMGGRDARKIARAVKEDLSMSGDSGDYGALSLGVKRPVRGYGRRENFDMAQMLMEGKEKGTKPKLTALAKKQGRDFIFFGNWPSIKPIVRKFRTKPKDGVSEEIKGRSEFGGAFYFLDQSMINIERKIVKELPPLIKKVFSQIDIERGK